MIEPQFTTAACVAREATAILFGPPFGWLVGGPVVRGREHLDGLTGPFLVAPSHASHLDVSAVRLAIGRRHRRRLAPAVAADYFGVSRVRWFFAAWLGAFAFDRSGHGGHRSIDQALRLLERGWNVLVFPEGTRSRTGDLGQFRPGIGLLAARSGVPVLPVRILGTHQVLPPGSRRPHRGHVEVRFGAPLRIADGEDPRRFAARLEDAVRDLGA